MEEQFENEFMKEEQARKALLRYGGNLEKVQQILKQPLERLQKIQTKMKQDLIDDPNMSLNIAANITQEIVNGRNQRKQLIQDMYDSLEDREQIWVCATCNTEVKDMVIDSDRGVEHFCPMCNKTVNRKLFDRGNVYDQKQKLIDAMAKEDTMLIDYMVRMGWTGNQPQAPHTVVHNRQNVLVLGDRKEGDSILTDKENKILDEIRHLPPLEAEKLRRELKEEIFTLDEQIRDTEAEIETAEEA